MSDSQKLSRDDVSKLADLARIDIDDKEKAELVEDLREILGYVREIQSLGKPEGDTSPLNGHINIMRADEVTNEPGEYTERILSEAPEREGDFVKVKKILLEE